MSDASPTASGAAPRIRLGRLQVDRHTQHTAVEAVRAIVRAGRGGRVYTPNLDHILLVERRPDFRDAYTRATLSLADGMPLVWASRWFGTPLPERISGSDLIEPVSALAAREGWRVFLLGGAPGTAEEAARRLVARHGVTIAGCASPRVDLTHSTADEAIAQQIREARPDVVFVALGSPKQELFIDRIEQAVTPAVLIGVGAGLDFLAGHVRRAPRWIGQLGFEWLFRLVVEPKRLWRRYLVGGPPALAALFRTPRAS
jgi:N-acetylglucosaminyldiphosphoundecaprenol N-acetyl-beta-D-mannosaminyltransferase